MKYIIAIIQPDRLDEVLALLLAKNIQLVTVSNVVGRGRQKGIAEVYRSHKEAGTLLKKVKLEIAVNDNFVEATIDAILTGARTGQIHAQIAVEVLVGEAQTTSDCDQHARGLGACRHVPEPPVVNLLVRHLGGERVVSGDRELAERRELVGADGADYRRGLANSHAGNHHHRSRPQGTDHSQQGIHHRPGAELDAHRPRQPGGD